MAKPRPHARRPGMHLHHLRSDPGPRLQRRPQHRAARPTRRPWKREDRRPQQWAGAASAGGGNASPAAHRGGRQVPAKREGPSPAGPPRRSNAPVTHTSRGTTAPWLCPPEAPPPTQRVELKVAISDVVSDPDLARAVQLRLDEAHICQEHGAYTFAVTMLGSLFEAVLAAEVRTATVQLRRPASDTRLQELRQNAHTNGGTGGSRGPVAGVGRPPVAAPVGSIATSCRSAGCPKPGWGAARGRCLAYLRRCQLTELGMTPLQCLLVLWHAESAHPPGVEDHDRPLTPHGRCATHIPRRVRPVAKVPRPYAAGAYGRSAVSGSDVARVTLYLGVVPNRGAGAEDRAGGRCGGKGVGLR